MSRILTFFCLIYLAAVFARKEISSQHHHQGVLRDFVPGPFDVSLQATDEKNLSDGKAVMKQVLPQKGETEAGGGAICVQDVEAPKQAVWNQILRLDDYAKKVPKVSECKNYDVRRNGNGSIIMKTRQKLKILPGYSYVNYYKHTFEPAKDSLVWRLDYEKKSDFNDVAGHWHLEDHPSKPGCTRVYYACDIKLNGSVPSPILQFISNSALRQATAWVKKESESAPAATIPGELAVQSANNEGSTSRNRFAFMDKVIRR